MEQPQLFIFYNESAIRSDKMTIKTPPDNVLDKILKIIRKKRKLIIPEETGQTDKKLGPYVTTKARKESFWRALFRDRH